jgi:hypothetical protein
VKGATAVWATNYQADFNEGKPIFNNRGDDFITKFRQNFKAQDEKQYVQACLNNLWQKGQTVEQYMAKFRLYAPCTKLSNKALCKHYYDHLTESITKNYLTYFGPKYQSKHLAKYLRYFARYLSSKYLR